MNGTSSVKSFLRFSWIIHPNRQDFEWFDWSLDCVSSYGERVSLRRLHYVGDSCSGRARRHMKLDRGCFAGPLVDAEDQGVGVFGLLHRSQHDVVGRDGDEGMR